MTTDLYATYNPDYGPIPVVTDWRGDYRCKDCGELVECFDLNGRDMWVHENTSVPDCACSPNCLCGRRQADRN
jgi:hypothetical protein